MGALLLLSLLSLAHAECPSTYPQVTGHVSGALDAYDDGLYEPFRAHFRSLQQDLPCLPAMLEPSDVLSLHLVTLYEAWGRKDEGATTRAFHSVLDLDPGFVIETEVKLSDEALQTLLERAQGEHGAPDAVPLPLMDWSNWFVNGAPAGGEVPVGRPTVLQLLNGQTYQVRTWWLTDGGVPAELASKAAVSHFEWGAVQDEEPEAPEPESSGPVTASIGQAPPLPESEREQVAPRLLKLSGLGLIVSGAVVAGVGANAQYGPFFGERALPNTVWYQDVPKGGDCWTDANGDNDHTCKEGYYWSYLFPLYLGGAALGTLGVAALGTGTVMARRTDGGWSLVWTREF